MPVMILVTGGTGFVGRALLRQLAHTGQPVRTLIRPSSQTPALPRGVAVEVAISALNDERSLRAALQGVDTIYHLAGAEFEGIRGNILETDARGTATLVRAAKDARVQRFFYVSHLGADRSSYFPVLKVKGVAEEYIRKSGMDFTIFRSGLLYGPEDHFTTAFARLGSLYPALFLPGNGEVTFQPLWVEDLITCLLWSLDNADTSRQTFEVGGAEYFTIRQALMLIMAVIGRNPTLIPLGLPYLRAATVSAQTLIPNFPFSTYWVDYFGANRVCATDTISRIFGFIPARFTYRLEHLKAIDWEKEARANLFKRKT
ncbi:MAG: hypothetical protein AUK01_09225 [Anaerolineae bacterium CG2_30_57_67]|nr:MAG: hypothetical protein AUK01_09225 [Anaerolineae bacterium CG2_30_57_67]